MDKTTPTPSVPGTVILGGGQAGIQTANSLREFGYGRSITIVADEDALPYQRPPLSKDMAKAGQASDPLPLFASDLYEAKDIELRRGVAAKSINRTKRSVALSDGSEIEYEHLVIAVGATNRRVSSAGADLEGIYGLRTVADADMLSSEIRSQSRVVIIGGGFIGLEFAASMRSLGAHVTVLEFAPRLMGRALSAWTGSWFANAHRSNGIVVRLNEGLAHFIPSSHDAKRIGSVVSTTGSEYPADFVLVGVGVIPNTSLADDCGLEVADGIVVDAHLRTSDPRIFSIGDCANFPSKHAGCRTRLESVQNARDQGEFVAKVITIQPDLDEGYSEFPWFWSVQTPFRIQIAGILADADRSVLRGDPNTGKFSVFCYKNDQLTAVESVNAPADHMAARRIFAGGQQVSAEDVADLKLSLKDLVARASHQPSLNDA